jgi:hypothetical protein
MILDDPGLRARPGRVKLRHRGDVERGLVSAPILLMKQFSLIEEDAASGGPGSTRRSTEDACSKKFR